MSATDCPSGRAAAFTGPYSIEATRPSAADIDAVAEHGGPGRLLYLSAVPAQPLADHAGVAAQARRAGLEPVVHLPARRFASKAELIEILARLRGEADVRRLLMLAGEFDPPGPFADALAVIRDGGLRDAGIEEIGITGYPEGHPRIGSEQLAAAMADKIAAAREQGLKLHIVTQFAFSAEPIAAWIHGLRAQGIALPVRIGLAGPTSLTALLRYAKRCGVNASMRGLASGAAASLIGNVGPEKIIDELCANSADLGEIRVHYFSFGGIADTARYAQKQAVRLAVASKAVL
jgi:methylenetetrahydrofolate reductase (NADPH)